MRIRSVKRPSTLELSEDSVLIDRHGDAWQPKRRDQKEHTWVKTERDPEPPEVVVEDEEHLIEEYGPLDLAWPRLFGPDELEVAAETIQQNADRVDLEQEVDAQRLAGRILHAIEDA